LNSGHIERNFQFVSVGALGDMTRGRRRVELASH
jgi:hypothetical protein